MNFPVTTKHGVVLNTEEAVVKFLNEQNLEQVQVTDQNGAEFTLMRVSTFTALADGEPEVVVEEESVLEVEVPAAPNNTGPQFVSDGDDVAAESDTEDDNSEEE